MRAISFTLSPINETNVAVFKATRLSALRESPRAFGSTHAQESQLSDSDWLKRATDWSGDRRVGFLALSDSGACGIVGACVDDDDFSLIELTSMWVAPTHRRWGIGRSLIEAVVDWARGHGTVRIRLTVTSNNMAAIRLYKQNGFSMTGRTEPYPNDPNLVEYEMIRDLLKPATRLIDPETRQTHSAP